MSNKINILFVLPNFDTGGSEKLVVDLASHLNPERFSPVICVFFSGVYEAKVKELGIPFYCVHEGGKIRSRIGSIKFLNKIISDHKIDIVNTHHTSPLVQGLLSFKVFNRVRIIHTEHTRLDCYDFIKPRHIALLKFCLRCVDRVLGISEGVCAYFRNELGIPDRKIMKILNGVDVNNFRIMDNGKGRMEKRQELGIGENDIVIGTFANFRKQKNHGLLLKAVKLLRDKGINNIKVVFAGDGPERQNIEQMIQDLCLVSCVLCLGARQDIPELMNMLDIYCLPSHFEGLPISLIEAFAAGKQVVATDVDGNRDVVREMGTGILVKPDDPEMLAEAILKIMEGGVRNTDDSKGPSSVLRSPFSFESMIKNYEDLFQSFVRKEWEERNEKIR
ncbi:MAG TPA: glycosyltransferase [Candidatus Omnitrophota bacterium]|nr:glycosyltransferase [Candidatus Omnitrophota bacterium]